MKASRRQKQGKKIARWVQEEGSTNDGNIQEYVGRKEAKKGGEMKVLVCVYNLY